MEGEGREISPALKAAFDRLKHELLALKQCHDSLENRVNELIGDEHDN